MQGYTVFSIPVGIVYRPNDAKVKNLKTKDYLGKARLVAATDRANAFTGFAGTEIKNLSTGISSAAKDDRPEDKISYAATNLVKPNLQSRSRQQSEPPLNRNVFPPTPPPENDRPVEKYANGSMTRAQSVRGGGPKPPPLELGRAAFDQESQRPRIGTQRSASERPRPTRESSVSSGTSRGRVEREREREREREPRRRMMDVDEDEQYEEEVYDMYQPPRSNRSTYSRRQRQRPMYIEEEEEDEYANSLDEPEFEMVSRSKTGASRRSPRSDSRGPPSQRGGTTMRKVRVKVHAEDTRYVLIKPNLDFAEFAEQIRDKFGFRKNFKIKIKDDGDMITMADQDDLDLALQTARSNARREGNEMGKMEVSFLCPSIPFNTTPFRESYSNIFGR
jgi:hypothetical protein